MELDARDFWNDGEIELFVLRPDDVTDAYVRWLNDPEINRFLESRFAEHTLHGLGEIGLMIGERTAWGRGIATRAISIISRIGLEQLGLRKITAGCYASNAGSQKAFEKADFFVEGLRKDHFLIDGETEDLVLLARFGTGQRPASRDAA